MILRHEPSKAGLSLGIGGWVRIETLLQGLNDINRGISQELLIRVVTENDKKRFSISEDGLLIRAAQGHSVDVDLKLQPKTPPALLYHGTARRFLNQIMTEGLKPMTRQHVHLSSDIKTAKKVGQRHGKVVVLSVNTKLLHNNGQSFFQADNGVWLTNVISKEWLKLLDQ